MGETITTIYYDYHKKFYNILHSCNLFLIIYTNNYAIKS